MKNIKYIIYAPINTNGNIKALIIDNTKKTFEKGYNIRNMDPFNIEINCKSLKDYNKIIRQLENNSYAEI